MLPYLTPYYRCGTKIALTCVNVCVRNPPANVERQSGGRACSAAFGLRHHSTSVLQLLLLVMDGGLAEVRETLVGAVYSSIWYMMWWYDIYLLTAIRLTSGGSSTVHIYTQTIHRTTQLTTNWEECGSCPVFASYTMAFALQLRKNHGKTSVRVAEEFQLARWKQNIQNRTYITLRIHKYNSKNT